MPDQSPEVTIEGLVLQQLDTWSKFVDEYGLDEVAIKARIDAASFVVRGEKDKLSNTQKGLLGQIGVGREYLLDEYDLIETEPRVRAALKMFESVHGTNQEEAQKEINRYTEWSVFYEGLLIALRLRRNS